MRKFSITAAVALLVLAVGGCACTEIGLTEDYMNSETESYEALAAWTAAETEAEGLTAEQAETLEALLGGWRAQIDAGRANLKMEPIVSEPAEAKEAPAEESSEEAAAEGADEVIEGGTASDDGLGE